MYLHSAGDDGDKCTIQLYLQSSRLQSFYTKENISQAKPVLTIQGTGMGLPGSAQILPPLELPKSDLPKHSQTDTLYARSHTYSGTHARYMGWQVAYCLECWISN